MNPMCITVAMYYSLNYEHLHLISFMKKLKTTM
jgi:hypothetical protein